MLINKSNDCPRCGSGHQNKCFVIYENGWHCFSCGATSVTADNYYSFKPKLLKNKSFNFENKIIKSPNNFSILILEWLYSYYIYDKDIKNNNIYYIPYDSFITSSNELVSGESLIFPIIQNNEIVFMQRRFFPSKIIFSMGDSSIPCLFKNDNCETIVLTEDFISAVRCSQTANSMCLFGTSMKNSIVDTILKYRNIIIWLDGDEPGQNAAKKIMTKLCGIINYRAKQYAFNSKLYRVLNIKTTKDPKCYSPIELKTIINRRIDG